MSKHIPTEITLHKGKRTLELAFEDGQRFELPCEYMRVFSPSAEVQGHGPGQGVLQIGKEDVMITRVDQVGTYAIQPSFDDGHHTGIYTWETLYNLGVNYEQNWQNYLERLKAAGHERKA